MRKHGLVHHFGVSLALLGVTVLFFAALVRAERREVEALQTPERDTAYMSFGQTLVELEAASGASAGFTRALLFAAVGMMVAAGTLLLHRPAWWAVAAGVVLICLLSATHAFATTRSRWRALRALPMPPAPAASAR